MMLYCSWWTEPQPTCTHPHTQSYNLFKLTFCLHFCDMSLTSNTLCLVHFFDFGCHSCLNLIMIDRTSERLLSYIYFFLHSFYFPTRWYKQFLFFLLLQKCCFAATVRWCCLKSHNYVLKHQTCTDTQTSMVVVNYLFIWDCREQIFSPISPVFRKTSWKGITSNSLLFVEMLHLFSPKNQQTAKMDRPKLSISK